MVRPKKPRYNLAVLLETKEREGILKGLKEVFRSIKKGHTKIEVGKKYCGKRIYADTKLLSFEKTIKCLNQTEI